MTASARSSSPKARMSITDGIDGLLTASLAAAAADFKPLQCCFLPDDALEEEEMLLFAGAASVAGGSTAERLNGELRACVMIVVSLLFFFRGKGVGAK